MGKLTISTGPFSIAMSYVNYGKTIERSTMHFSWVVIHYFDWAMFNINHIKSPYFPMVFHGSSHHLPGPTSLKIHQDFRFFVSGRSRSSSRPTSEEVPSCRSLDKGSPDEQRGTPKTRGVDVLVTRIAAVTLFMQV